MIALFLSLFASWPVAVGEALLREWHTYDLLRCDVVATPGPGGLDVGCTLTLRPERPGPLRFLLSSSVSGLTATQEGRPVSATLGGDGLARLVRLVAPEATDIPALLTLAPEPPPTSATTVRIRLDYRWHPTGDGLCYATARGVDTHLSGFWVPTMADETFEATLQWRGDFPAVSSAAVEAVQVLALVAGEFEIHRRAPLQLLLPKGVDADADALLTDLVAVLQRLTEWFGPCGSDAFTLVVSPRTRPAPSYCAGAFAVVHASVLPGAAGRLRWIEHLAHECSHRWWGHAVPMPILGGGGTWLREGLAQWSGIRVAGEMLGVGAQLDRAHVRAYLGRLDLRRAGGAVPWLFANEATLLDATYLDDPSVAYVRGALVHRLLEWRVGEERFLALLRSWPGGGPRDSYGYGKALGLSDLVEYYAGTTRLPDFVLDQVVTGPGKASALVRCLDPLWPPMPVPCLIELDAGPNVLIPVAMRDGRGTLAWSGTGTPQRIEIDPERLLLDPIRSNSVWPPPKEAQPPASGG